MKRIKVIQIGIGHDHATAVLDSLLRQNNVFDVAALAVPETEKTDFAERLENYRAKVSVMSVRESFEICGVDAAVIETEEENLTAYAYSAAEKGLAVI